MNAKGFVHKYGDNVDTDVIIPARYLNIADKKELATHCMEDIDKNFVQVVKGGDVMVGGFNFGCGSSREHAPMVIKESGISCVIAKTFARIFYRNAINIGLAILECPEASENIQSGDEVAIDFDTGLITNLTKGETYQANPFPAFIKEMLVAVAKNWNGSDSGKVELQALLPEGERKKLDAAFEESAKELLAAGVEVGWSKEVKTGFKVGAKEGGYYISFADADIEALLAEYLRDKVFQLLFKA